MIQKWNYKTRSYEEYNPDPNWRIVLFSGNMEEEINCSSCGKPMTYGQGYTSKEIHNKVGLGYPVCEKCYGAEIERESKQSTSFRDI